MDRLERGDALALPLAPPRPHRATAAGYNLLRLPLVRALVNWSGFPYVFQAGLLAAFVALAALGWGRTAPPGVPAKTFAKSHLVTLLIWGLWWPAMVWTAVLLGRAWCLVCPLELVSNLCERAGRRLGLPQRGLAHWLAAGWLIVALYAGLQVLVAGLWLHRSPHYTTAFLLSLLGLAAVTGLLLKDRAFCRGFCPVGVLLGTYGRGGMLAVRAAGGEACAACSGQHCRRAGDRTKLDARSCPSLLNPPTVNSNRDCLVCGQCLKACQPDNMQILLRRPFARQDARESPASWPVTLFAMLVSGFVLSEVCSEWPAAQQLFLAAPQWIEARLHAESAAGWLEGVWTLFVVPAVFWSMLAGIARLAGARGTPGAIWRRLALPLAVLVSAAHMAKGLAKVSSWAGHLPPALGLAARPAPALLPLPVCGVIGLALLAAAGLLAVREARRAAPTARVAPVAWPVALTGVLFAAIVGGWMWEA